MRPGGRCSRRGGSRWRSGRGGRGARSCGVTHVLLPAWLLARRCDGTTVIGDMLARAARGQGFRSIAAATGVPEGTVRDRLRRFRSSAGRVREFFTRLAGVLAVDPVPLDPAGSPLGDAVVAVAAAAAAARGPVAGDGRGVGVGAGGGAHAGVASVPVRRVSPVFAGRRAGVCPGLTVQRGLAPARGGCFLSLSVRPRMRAGEKGQSVATAGRGGQEGEAGAGPGDGPVPVLAGAGAGRAGHHGGRAGAAGQGAGRPCP